MKFIRTITTLIALSLVACQTNLTNKTANDETMIIPVTYSPVHSTDTLTNSESETEKPMVVGETLIKSNDCMVCHDKYDQVIGPSFSAISKKYTIVNSNIELLTNKVIEGGGGNWGNIPMQAHPNVSKKDAEEMIRYILSVKQ